MSVPETLELLRFAVEKLESLKIRYFITGSVAAMFVGKPRMTNDIDIVVELESNQVHGIEDAFAQPRFYFSDVAALAAARNGGMFNVVEVETGLKIDFIVPVKSEWSEVQFQRAKPGAFDADASGEFVSTEDLILNKLLFYRDGGSEKHLRDIAGVLGVQGGAVDRGYIADWAGKHGVLEVWEQVIEAEQRHQNPDRK